MSAIARKGRDPLIRGLNQKFEMFTYKCDENETIGAGSLFDDLSEELIKKSDDICLYKFWLVNN